MCARFILRDREFLPLGTLRIGSSSLVCSYSWSTILTIFPSAVAHAYSAACQRLGIRLQDSPKENATRRDELASSV